MVDGKLWWMARRAKIEGEAVRIWLQKHNSELAGLLDSLSRRDVVNGVCSASEPTWPQAPA
jgi:hypothetical protein